MTDDALILAVTQAQQGDHRAFDWLVRRYQTRARIYAGILLRDPIAAEDAAQDAFVQAWRDLPRLAEPAAFSGWLRCIVFKFCDRARRAAHPTVPLDDTLCLPVGQEPQSIAEQSAFRADVHAAIETLSAAQREAVLLYYITGHDIKEIAEFLDVPLSTVKNRLHVARKHLRKELGAMAEMPTMNLPNTGNSFADNVLARILRDFQHQESTDRSTADRGLLDQGREALFAMLGRGEMLDDVSMISGFQLLDRKQDWPAMAAFLMKYLTQTLSDSQTAWAYLHLANAIALSGNAAGAVLAHETFERWLPGRSPSLSPTWPYLPVSDENRASTGYGPGEVRLQFLALSLEFSTAYRGVWRSRDYLAKVDAALAEVPLTQQNRLLRFYVLRTASDLCEGNGDFARAASYIQQMHDLADGADDPMTAAEIHVKALGHEINLARCRGDDAAFQDQIPAMIDLLNSLHTASGSEPRWATDERHDLACQLVWEQQYSLALPLWEACVQFGSLNGYGLLLYATSVWQVLADKPRTLALLREARLHDDRDMGPLFQSSAEFAEVRDDAEFLGAIGR